MAFTEGLIMPQEPIWYCKIGIKDAHRIKFQRLKDAPMRDVVETMFFGLTGIKADFIFSGWSASLTDREWDVVNGRDYAPVEQERPFVDGDELTLELTEAEIVAEPVKQVISPEQWKAAVEEIALKMRMPERQVNSLAQPVTSYGELARKLAERAHQREYLRKLEEYLKRARNDRDVFFERAIKAQSSGANFASIQQELSLHEKTITEIKAEIEREKGKIDMTTATTLRCCDGHFDPLNNGYVHHPSCLHSNSARPADVAVDDSAGEDVTVQEPGPTFREGLEGLIHYHSVENVSKTPVPILADFLHSTFAAYNAAVTARGAPEPETNFGFYVDGYTLAHSNEDIGGVKITAMDGRTETIKTSQLCAFLERRLPEPD